MAPVNPRSISLTIALACAFAAVQPSAQSGAAPVTVIKAARLIDGTGAAPIESAAAIVTGDTITWVGKAADLKAPAGARVIDLGRQTLLPGLFDCHVHITGVPGDGGDTQELRETDANKAIYGVVHSKLTLEAGFTTVRDVGGSYATVALRDSIAKGLIPGPHMYVATYSIGITGGHGDINGWSPNLKLPGTAMIADGIEGVRKAVREQVKYGADLIKVVASGGILSVGDSPSSVQYSFEELKTIVDEAGHSGRKVAAHAHGAQSIKDAIHAGIDSIEHASLVDDEGIRLAKEHGTYFVMDIYNDDYILGKAKDFGIPQEFLDKEKKLGQLQRDNFRKAFEAGVKMAFGTDAGVYPHGDNAKQFFYMVKYGMTPAQAILAATASAADLTGRSADIGSIEAGKYADIIAVTADPMKDVRALESVDFVMKGGKIYKQGGKATQ